MIGYLSDRTWSRLGRRRPYFLVGAVLASLALFAFLLTRVDSDAAGGRRPGQTLDALGQGGHAFGARLVLGGRGGGGRRRGRGGGWGATRRFRPQRQILLAEAGRGGGRHGRAGEGDPLCAELVTELDKASAQLRQVLWSRALKGTEKDGRLALEAIKHLDDAPLRRARLRLAKAQAAVEARRATGEHVDRQRVEGAGIRVYLPEES